MLTKTRSFTYKVALETRVYKLMIIKTEQVSPDHSYNHLASSFLDPPLTWYPLPQTLLCLVLSSQVDERQASQLHFSSPFSNLADSLQGYHQNPSPLPSGQKPRSSQAWSQTPVSGSQLRCVQEVQKWKLQVYDGLGGIFLRKRQPQFKFERAGL